MRLLDHIIPRRTAMPDQPDAITCLRKASYALEDLPETIALPQRAGDEPREPLTVTALDVDRTGVVEVPQRGNDAETGFVPEHAAERRRHAYRAPDVGPELGRANLQV